MTQLLRASVLALFGLVVATPAALAEKATYSGVMVVDDRAGVFTPDGVKKATDDFHATTFKAKTNLTVVTMKDIPESKKKDFEAARSIQDKDEKTRAGKRFFGDWARELANERKEPGVFVLVYATGDMYFVMAEADRQADVQRHFTDKDAGALADKIKLAFAEAKQKKQAGEEARKTHDKGLHTAASFVIDQLKDTTVADAKHKVSTTTPGEKKGMGIGGWICLGLCVLLGVWVVVALIRALTGGGGGGYGGGMGGPGMGGGGGGFFSSLLGGMFGAAAGMWMYNNFFGGSHYNDMSAGESYGGDAGPTDTGAGDYDGGAEGGGGDWGDGGGDTGGGDTGGGGDWGDAGGGGGDWGGGGGDFGGGGGDFGGGGDW